MGFSNFLLGFNPTLSPSSGPATGALNTRGRRVLIAVMFSIRRLTVVLIAVWGSSFAATSFAQDAASVQVPPSPTTSPNYVIGPGDTLQVFVWRNPELTTSVPVRPDGKITTPLVQDMVAVGKTPSQLARDIEGVLAEFIRTPQVNVIVSTPLSVFSQVKVIGQVTTPQSLPYREGMKVLDAVLAAGGLGQFAAGNRAKIVRQENGKQVEIKIKLESLINKGEMKYNFELRPGDVLVVPESMF